MKVSTVTAEPAPEVPRRKLALLARRVLRGEKGDLDISIVFADDKTLRRLNRMYRQIGRTTDVLSFNIPRVLPKGRDVGELYVSLAQARRQARRHGHSLAQELQVLIVHGVLHLLGHDHKRPHETKSMRARERYYLGGLAE